jgi:hypothetical protein
MTSFADDFNRADSTNLGAGWVEVSGDWSIVSNQLSPGAAGGTIILRAATAAATDDNYSQVAIASATVASQGVWCRGDATIANGYLWRNNGTQWDLFSVVGGSFTVIGTFVAAAANGDVMKVQAVGTAIKGFVNGVERASATNSAVATGKNFGIRSESVSGVRYDNYAGGDVSSGSDVPATITQDFGALGGGITGVPEVTATVGQSFGALGGSTTATRETFAAVSGAFGGLTGTVVIVPPTSGLVAPTTTQVVLAWLRQYVGYSRCAAQLPQLSSWLDSGDFVVLAGVVGGSPGLYVPEQGPVVQLDFYAANRAKAGSVALSRKPPRGRAESLANEVIGQTYASPVGFQLTLPANYRPVWLTTIYPVSEVRELPTADENLARYSVDIFVGWIERTPVG